MRTRPDVGVDSLYVTVTARTWEPSSLRSKSTNFWRLVPGWTSTPVSFSVPSGALPGVGEGGPKVRGTGIPEEGIFISASILTLLIVF